MVEVIASARILPERMCGCAACSPAKLKWYSLASSAASAGPEPL